MQRKVHCFDNGVRVYDDHLIAVQRERYRKRNVHEAEEEDLFITIVENLLPAGCFVNIGSAIGYYLFLAKKIAPGLVIHAVEPLAEHRAHFLENVALNGFSAADFTLHSEAVFATAKETVFLEQGFGSKVSDQPAASPPAPAKTGRNPLTALLKRLRGGAAYGSSAEGPRAAWVKTITLDMLVDRVGGKVDLLQMDVQGAEYAILTGGARSLEAGLIGTMLIGTHGPGIHEKCLAFLQEKGYTIEFEEYETHDQPDGIVVAGKGVLRLKGGNDG